MKQQIAVLKKPYDRYCITNDGLIFSINNDGSLRKLKPFGSGKNLVYKTIKLSNGLGNFKNFTIHRLVLLTFSGEPKCDNAKIARHLNDDKNDNRIENLAWGSSKDNSDDAIKNGKHGVKVSGEQHGMSKLTNQQVALIKKDLIADNLSVLKISKKYNISTSVIYSIKAGKSRKNIK